MVMPVDECTDLSLVLVEEGASQACGEADRPQGKGGVPSAGRACHRDSLLPSLRRRKKAIGKVQWKEWRVGCNRQDAAGISARTGPFQARQYACKRTGKTFDGILHDWPSEGRQPCRIAVRIDGNGADLPLQTIHDVCKQRPPFKHDQRLVAAPHPPCTDARQDNPCNWLFHRSAC